PPRAQLTLALTGAPSCHQHQKQGQFSRGFRKYIGRVGNFNAAARCGFEINMFESCPKICQDSCAPPKSFQDCCINSIGDSWADRIELAKCVNPLDLAKRGVRCVHGHVVTLHEVIERLVWPNARYKNLWKRHVRPSKTPDRRRNALGPNEKTKA